MKLKHYTVVATLAVALSTSCSVRTVEQKEPRTVSVSGTGTVSVAPDMIRMSVSMSKIASTTRQAQETVGKTVAQVLEILKEAGIDEKSIGTASLRFSPEYEWRRNGQVLLGQRAEQTVTFPVHGIADDPDKAPRIIDRLTQLNGIVLNGVDFDVKDRSAQFARSRELAFQKAAEKAEQYAVLAGRKLKGVFSISEGGAQHLPLAGVRQLSQNRMHEEKMTLADDASTVLPSGKLEITTSISVVYLME
jgi:uncharacterized protein YggE